VYWLSKTLHRSTRYRRQLGIFLAVLGPGIITMVADNDAGGISTYAVTGSKYGFSLLWILVILVPVAYFIQEMTVRLGAVTKRGHAEVIFEGFGPVWGWFSVRSWSGGACAPARSATRSARSRTSSSR
jgi:Mn2+/Fe2+ NRAMP family transporter